MAGRQEILEHVAQLLDSEQFIATRSVAKLLTFCVDAALAGNEENLKETTIGIFCFGRSPGYDTKQDPIVRVTARRLRKKLELFYQNAGENHELQIVLPKGTYVPRFSCSSNPAAVAKWSGDERPVILDPTPVADVKPLALLKIPVEIHPRLASGLNWLTPATWSYLVLLLMASGAIFLARTPLRQDVKAVVPLENPSPLSSSAAWHETSESAGVPSAEQQIQMKRQMLGELSSLLPAEAIESHEKPRAHPTAMSTNMVASFEPRL